LKRLRDRAQAPGTKAEQVRDEVFQYCRKYAGTRHASRATELLRKLPPLVNSIGMKLVPIPPGKFVMGSLEDESSHLVDEGPQHEVLLTRGLYLGMHEVTVGQFKAFVHETAYRTEAEKGGGARRVVMEELSGWNDPQANWRRPELAQTDEHPVVCVSYNDALAFCAWLSKKEGRNYSLPTEAEWEYACRAGTHTPFHFGAQLNGTQANVDGRAPYGTTEAGPFLGRTCKVGSYSANAFGLYDMHGNVWEWCQDWYDRDWYGKDLNRSGNNTDPQGPANGDFRVIRGGGWVRTWHSRAAQRNCFGPTHRDNNLGLRVCLRLD
jgi:formylglycine-generating enzyme required for sulfatase activity